ncbi:MAG: hypothetical protein K9K76_11475 [Halanaerobiales bacterium]|nr:hypothetical protein [Halanaerobiales bacterium]
MSTQLKPVSKIGKIIFVSTRSLNLLIYYNDENNLSQIYNKLNDLDVEQLKYNKIMDIVDKNSNKKVLLNQSDIEIINKNSDDQINFFSHDVNNENMYKYIFASN